MVTGIGGYRGVSNGPHTVEESQRAAVYAAGMEPGADDPDGPPQGWFVDPFGVHEQRWFSQGSATALVRDGRSESQDPPPDRPIDVPLVRATPALRAGPPSDDLLRADRRDRDVGADSQFDFFGNAALPGTVGMPTSAPLVTSGGPLITVRTDGVPVTPKRVVRNRWVTLGIAAVWTLLLTGLLLAATSTTHTGTGPAHTRTVLSSDPGGVIAFVAILVVAVVVTGVGFARRLRSRSVAPDRIGYGAAGILGILGVLSLASIGLALVILAAALAVVARPLKRPRPLPGERVT